MTPTLHSTRLTLRPRVAEDAEALFPTMADAEAMRWWSYPPFTQVEDLRAHFAEAHPDWRGWAVTWRDDDRAIGFVAAGQRRVFADIDPDNAPSIRLVERLGFTIEGRLRAEWETHIGVRDTLIYGLLRDEWRA